MSPKTRFLFLFVAGCLAANSLQAQRKVEAETIQATQTLSIGKNSTRHNFTGATDTITAGSTHQEIPTAKSVWDLLGTIGSGGGGGGGGHVLAGNGTPVAQKDTADFRSGDVTFLVTNTATATRVTANIAPDSVTTTEIRNGTIVAADLGQMGATTGQLLRWSGTAWAPNGTNLYDVVTSSGSIATKNNQVWVNTLSAAIALNLPACNASNDGLKFEIIKAGSDTFKVDIEPAGSELFSDGAATKSLYSRATGLSCTCRWNGSSGSWFYLNL